MVRIRHRIGAGGVILLVGVSLLCDTVPLLGVLAGIGLSITNVAEITQQLSACGPGVGGLLNPLVSLTQATACLVHRAPGALVGATAGVGLLAFAPAVYMVLSFIAPIIYYFIMVPLFLVFRHFMFGMGTRGILANLTVFVTESLPLLNIIIPGFTISTLLHIQAVRSADTRHVKQQERRSKHVGKIYARQQRFPRSKKITKDAIETDEYAVDNKMSHISNDPHRESVYQ